MKLAGKKSANYETIYQMIYADHKKLGIFKQYLRQNRRDGDEKEVSKTMHNTESHRH
jgi:hypothetical protein